LKGCDTIKELTVAVCVDERMGMTFNKRRQSADRGLIAELLSSVEGKIYISEFSLKLFEKHPERIRVVNNPIEDAPNGAICFVENMSLKGCEGDISTLILYNWNEPYPYDTALELDIGMYKLESEQDFVGSSHEKITKSRYTK